HVSPRAGTNEAGGHDLPAVEPPLVVERLPVNQPAGSLALLGAADLLHDEPLRETPRADAPCRLAGIVRIGRRREEPRRCDTRHDLELAREPGLRDLVQVPRLRPRIEPTDDRRVPGQIDERAGSVGGDDLAAADLPVRLPAHVGSSTWMPLRSFRNRLTSGSTSRSDRLARNFLWCSDSKSLSSTSRKSGLGWVNSYFWYCRATPAAR